MQHRPIPIGVSTGHPDITAGTLGARVVTKDVNGNETGVYALSNSHVYADSGAATIGEVVLQPGAFDGGTVANDRIGTLAAFEPIITDGSTLNLMDAAIARIDTGVILLDSTPPDGYGTPSSQTATVEVGDLVQKYGRTTGWTHGTVLETNVTVRVCYGTIRGPNCFGPLGEFTDQITISY